MTQAPSPETPETPDETTSPEAQSPSPAPEEAAVAVAEAPAVLGPSPATDPALLKRALEGLLFITDRPLSAVELGRLVGVRDQERIASVVEELRAEVEARGGGYRLMAVAEGWQMATSPDLAPFVRKLFSDRATMRLSTAAQETLSIIAYKQPLTRAEIEEIRGVEVIAALETLLEKRLVKVVGRKETVGRPLMYGTTLEFLRHFGLRSLEDLPPIDTFAPAEQVPAAVAPADAPAAPEPAVPAADFAAAEEAPAAPKEPGDDEEPGRGGIWPD